MAELRRDYGIVLGIQVMLSLVLEWNSHCPANSLSSSDITIWILTCLEPVLFIQVGCLHASILKRVEKHLCWEKPSSQVDIANTETFSAAQWS